MRAAPHERTSATQLLTSTRSSRNSKPVSVLRSRKLDSATHYDLGVAYKEMGLVGDALTEFGLAARDPARDCMCHAMIGLIYLEQNDVEQAIEAYARGLDAAQKTTEQEFEPLL